MHTLTITIQESTQEEGYIYDIYTCTPEDIEAGADSEDGGLCTGTIEDALTMATQQAQALLLQARVNQ